MEGFTFWAGHNPSGFHCPNLTYFVPLPSQGFQIVIYLDDMLVLVCSKQAGKRAHWFLCPLLVRLGLHINFSKSDLHLTQTFCFLGLCWDTVHMSVSLPPDNLADIQQLALSLLQSQYVTVCRVMSFLGKPNFCSNGHSQFWCLCGVIQSDMLHVLPFSQPFIFSYSFFPFLIMSAGTVISFASEPSSFAICTSWCGYCYWYHTHSLGLSFSGIRFTFIS